MRAVFPPTGSRSPRRQYVPELLPKFVAVFGEAERAGSWDLVRGAWGPRERITDR